jgi:hypothetical protein
MMQYMFVPHAAIACGSWSRQNLQVSTRHGGAIHQLYVRMLASVHVHIYV